MRIRRILGEPMLHFLFIGIALFAVYSRMSPGSRSSGNHIVITQAVVDDLVTQHTAARGRAPSPIELGHLLENWVREEILYREGVALGLDRDDIVVKRRVRQKLEVMAEEEAQTTPPTDAELAAYLSAHLDRFTQPAVLSFEQRGQSVLLPHRMLQMPADLVARDFGPSFAQALERAPIGAWTGPITSSFGVHYARVSARTPPVVPRLEEVRDQVVREWENDRRQHARDESYAKMRAGYRISVEATLPGEQR